jgi:hypothetical protein
MPPTCADILVPRIRSRALFFTSRAARHVTGALLVADGGMMVS